MLKKSKIYVFRKLSIIDFIENVTKINLSPFIYRRKSYTFMKNIQEPLTRLFSKKNIALLYKILIAVFVISALIGLVLFFTKRPKQVVKEPTDTLPSVKIAPDQLWLPNELLPLPPIQFSREQKQIWSDEEIKSFFVEPDEDTKKLLHDKNIEKIHDLLEGVE